MSSQIKIVAIIVAAGRGTRAGGVIPKQWQPILGKPVIKWSVDTFLNNKRIDQVVVVYHADDRELMLQLSNDVHGVIGGSTRQESVMQGLNYLKDNPPDFVLIHDAARPCLDQKLLEDCIKAVLNKGAIVPAIACKDTLLRGNEM